MNNIRFLKVFVIVTISLICLVSFPTSVFADEKDYRAENGVVEIYSGLSDMNEHFYKIKNCSGFIVSNSESGCYIVTASNGVTISSNERKKCLKKNKLNNDSFGYINTIKVIINGDVATTLTTVATSKNENFTILRAENVINEKTPLKLGNSVKKGDYVSSLGFVNNSTNLYMQYNENDVMRFTGNVANPKVSLKNNNYIEHTANFDRGCLGGPLVNTEGYVVGLNCIYNTDGECFSLGIDTIKNILDNYSITYSSLNYDNAFSEYTKLIDECNSKCESDKYTSESIEKMKLSLEEVKLSVEGDPSINNVNSAINTLNNAKSELVAKTNLSHKVIYVLSGFLSALLIWLIIIMIKLWLHNPNKKPKVRCDKGEDKEAECEKKFEELVTIPKTHHTTKNAYIKSVNSQLRVKIDKNNFTIGSNIDEVDFSVNNKTVSRKHATIKYIEDKFVIFDNNSVNGTYVNDVFVENCGKELKNGDLICLANEKFIFEERIIR